MHGNQQSNPNFYSCVFLGNTALDDGGGFLNEAFAANQGGSPRFVNCLLTDNRAIGSQFDPGQGGAMYNGVCGTLRVINCTIAYNLATTDDGAGGIHSQNVCSQDPGIRCGGTNITNAILWGNSNPELFGLNDVNYSIIEGLGTPSLSGVCDDTGNNLGTDPQFVFNGLDFHLQAGSVAIDSGNTAPIQNVGDSFDLNSNGNVNEALPDLDFRLRLAGASSGVCGIVDRGAYEYAATGCFADCAPQPGGDGVVNVTDLLAVISQWGACQPNPAPCAADIAAAPCGDGQVNVTDLLAIIGAWGVCPGPAGGDGGLAGGIPQSYYDCQNMCSGAGENWSTCMRKCFILLCEQGQTQFCDPQ